MFLPGEIEHRIKRLGYKPCYYCNGTRVVLDAVSEASFSVKEMKLVLQPRKTICPECRPFGGLVPPDYWEEQVVNKESNLKAMEVINNERTRRSSEED